MSLKKFGDNECGLTYTIEAILGVALILGTVIFATGNLPYVAQKTGEHSKVQLMNIGRDTLDLTLITPINETCPSCRDPQVDRQYLLVADKTFVMPDETVNFTVTYSNGTPVNKWLTLQNTILGSGNPFLYMTNINNTAIYKWSDSPQNLSEFSIRAIDSLGGVSNTLTIKVGWYFLDSNTDGVYGSDVVSGWVKNSSGEGVNGLTINVGTPTFTTCPNFFPSMNTTYLTGNFSFIWDESLIKLGETYYIEATDGIHSSNKHLISYSRSGGGGTLWVYGTSPPQPVSKQNITIFELDTAYLYETGKNIAYGDIYVNYVPYSANSNFSLSPPDASGNMTFTAYLAGDYYIYEYKPSGTCTGQGPVKTNSILIHVLPLVPATGETQDNCVDKIELNNYMHRYVPPNVNYNLYLIGPDGKRFSRCPKFQDGQLINGYPTDKAVAVNKLLHIKYAPTSIDNILELRMVLWYK